MKAVNLGPDEIGMKVQGSISNNGYVQDITAPIVAILFNYEDLSLEIPSEPIKGELAHITVQTMFYAFVYAPDDEVTIYE